jgi:(p)ppGpp synthase/HD superfamily hydrolase
MNPIEQAVELASRSHMGQMDEDGLPHIIHCFEVFHRAQAVLEEHKLRGYAPAKYTDEEILVASMLHDTVEDSPVTLDQIEQEFGKNVREIVDSVTRRVDSIDGSKEFYRDFIYRAKANEGGLIVKYADLTHNLSRSVKIKKASWRNKLQFKYSIALTVLNDTSNPTWEQASCSVQAEERGIQHYYIADPNGKEIEVTEAEFKTLTGKTDA